MASSSQYTDGRRRAKPQVFSLFHPVPPRPYLSAEEPTASAVSTSNATTTRAASTRRSKTNDVARYHSPKPTPKPQVSAIAVSASSFHHAEPAVASPPSLLSSPNNKLKYRSPPASKPGAVSAAYRHNLQQLQREVLFADEPDQVAFSSPQQPQAEEDEKAKYRVAASKRARAFLMDKERERVETVSAKGKHHAMPASRPGAVATGRNSNSDDDDDHFLAKERERLNMEASLNNNKKKVAFSPTLSNMNNNNNSHQHPTRRQMEDKLYAMELQMDTRQIVALAANNRSESSDDGESPEEEEEEKEDTEFQDEPHDENVITVRSVDNQMHHHHQFTPAEEAAPSSPHRRYHAENKFEGKSKEFELVQALEVNEDEERKLLQSADRFDPNREARRLYRQPCFMCLLTVLICGGIAGLLVGLLVIRGGTDSDAIATDSPSRSPTTAPTTTHEVQLRAWLDGLNISQSTLDYAPVAYDLAVEWHANVDPAINRTQKDEIPWDFTRFVLAWVYYTSSSNGTIPWYSCNPPDYSRGENDTCTYLKFAQASSDRRYLNFTQVPGSQRWLSGASVCTWPGVHCLRPIFPEGHPAFACNSVPSAFLFVAMGLTGPFPIMLNQLVCPTALQVAWNPGLIGTLSPELFNFRSPIPYGLFQQFLLINNTGMGGKFPESLWV